MSKKLLARALKRAESTAGLARALHVSPSTVSRWKRDGAPKERKDSLERFLKSERASEDTSRTDRQRFLELMKVAGSLEKLPDIKSVEKPREGRLTKGFDSTLRVSQFLTLGLIDRIEVWVKKLKKRFPDWQLVCVVSQYGRGEHRGYKTVYHQLAPEAGDFAISAEIATPRMHSLREAIDLLRGQLEDLAQDPKVLTFVHAVTAFNYRIRTIEESSAWETAQRKKRTPKTTTSRRVAQGWGSHPIGITWPAAPTKPTKQKSPKSKSRTPTTTRSSASRPSSKKPVRATAQRSKPASSRKASASSTPTRKYSSTRRPATTASKVKKTKVVRTLRTPSRKTMRTQVTKTAKPASKKRAKKSQVQRRKR